MKRRNEKLKLIALVILALLLSITIAIITQFNTPRSSKAQLYDSQCLSEPIANPLKECKEEFK